MVKNVLLIGIILELIVFSTIIILDNSEMTVELLPMKETHKYEEKIISGEFFNEVIPASQQPDSLSKLKQNYQRQFEDLEKETHRKLLRLATKAYEEYQQSEQDLVSLLGMTKYASALKALEVDTDEAFYQIYDELMKELVMKGYSDLEGIEFKQKYEEKKKNQINEIIKMATSELNNH